MGLESHEPSKLDLAQLRVRLHTFANERGWQHYHSPKNLAMSVAIEVGELLECFQWLPDDQASEVRHQPALMSRIRSELADVVIYLIHLADLLEVDLLAAAWDKINANEHRYPKVDSQ